MSLRRPRCCRGCRRGTAAPSRVSRVAGETSPARARSAQRRHGAWVGSWGSAGGLAVAESVVRRGCGEIGKHARFRAWWAQALEGSSPFSRIPPAYLHARLSTPGRAYSRAPFHTGARLSRAPFHAGAGLSADLAVPIAGVRVPLLRFDGRVEAGPVDAAGSRPHLARAGEKKRPKLLCGNPL